MALGPRDRHHFRLEEAPQMAKRRVYSQPLVEEDPRVAPEALVARAKARAHSVHLEVAEQREAKVAFLE
jgi:hypothetical protein